MKKEQIRIKQRHDDCHYETIMWTNFNWQPVCSGYGFTQEQADTNCINAFLKGKKVEAF